MVDQWEALAEQDKGLAKAGLVERDKGLVERDKSLVDLDTVLPRNNLNF